MRNVRVVDHKYFLFFDRVIEIPVPERWEDLNERQFETCAGIYVNPLHDVDFISRFFGLKKRIVKRMTKFEQYKLTDLVGFAMSPKGTTNFFFMEEIPGTNLLSPACKLRGVSIEHFSLFDTFFFDYANNPTAENLCQLVASIYLKKWEKVTDIDFEKRVKYVSRHVDKSTQYAIFLNYVFLRDWLSKAFPFLFQKADTEDKPESKRKTKPASRPNRPDWTAMIDSLVGDDILNYDQYKEMPCILAFKTINKRIKEWKKNGK